MARSDSDLDEELTRWLIDAGRRRRVQGAAETDAPPAPPEDLVRYLEQLTERKFRSRADVLRLFQNIRDEQVAEVHAVTRRRIIRESLLLCALTASYLHYYYWDTQLQIASLPAVQVFVPLPSPAALPRVYHPGSAA